uniref:CSON011110 protein n=1 Tax=Culicoides sonorensis TaxID=179676 RepID=A0A336LLD5_CULSO
MLLNIDTSQLALDNRQLSTVLLFLVLDVLIQGAKAASKNDVEMYLEHGRDYLARGQLSEALNAYHSAVEGDPSNYLTYYKRGTVYLALGKAKFAINDFTKVLELRPDFTAARIQKGNVHMKLGEYDEAEREYYEVLQLDPHNPDVNYQYSRIEPARDQYNLIQELIAREDFATVANLLTQMLEISPWSAEFREERANAYLHTGDSLSAVSDLRSDCIDTASKVLKHEKEVQMIIFSAKQLMCSCSVKDEQYTEAIRHCREALDIYKDPQVLCDRAEAYLGSDSYDDAIHDYQAAIEIDENLQRAKDGIERAKKMQKQAEKRDYYKILGVKRNANKQEIIKAYRKAAQKWHPDNFPDPDEKKLAEKKFIDIAAAKEVLTDPEKRQQFDQGEDPLDPESGQNPFRGGGHPFHHFQHGSPFQFKFHFS